jgi:hypothetical protein
VRTPARRLYGYLFTLDNEPLAGPVEGDGRDDLVFELTGAKVAMVQRDMVTPSPALGHPHMFARLLVLEKSRLPSWTQIRLNIGTTPPYMTERDICRASVEIPEDLRA